MGSVDLAARPAAPFLKRGVLIPVRLAARGARLVGVGHTHVRVIRRPRPPDEPAVSAAATHDRVAPLMRLLKHRRIHPVGNHSAYAHAAVIDNLGADRARREPASNYAVIDVDRCCLRTKSVVVAQSNAATHADIICDHQTVFGAHHPGPDGNDTRIERTNTVCNTNSDHANRTGTCIDVSARMSSLKPRALLRAATGTVAPRSV